MNASPRKEAATSFMKLVAANKVAEAYAAYVAPDFRHHNAYYPGNAAALQKGMEESAQRFPDKQFTIQRTVEEGDVVVVHSRMLLQPGMPEVALVHIFRFADDRIAELWDISQVEPEGMANELGMF